MHTKFESKNSTLQCFSDYAKIPDPLLTQIESFAYSYGQSYDSYLITEDNRHIFMSCSGEGMLGFIPHWNHYHVIGGLLAENNDDKIELLDDFIEYANTKSVRTIVFHNILAADLHIFTARGCQATKCGEEPIIDLQDTSWTGKPYHWVRRQENFCKRQGLSAEEVIPSWHSPYYRDIVAPELTEISKNHIRTTNNGHEFNYFAGRFKAEQMNRKRVFIAKNAQRIEAFIVCNPAKNGRFWAIEMYRYRQDAPRGTMPFLWMHALRTLKAENVQYASLSMMPFYNCEQKYSGDHAFLRNMNAFWFKHLNWIFNAQGLHLFKSRFRPNYRPMFTVAYPKTTLLSLWSAFQLWEISSLMYKPKRLLQNWQKQRS